jgi:hypothetical protein
MTEPGVLGDDEGEEVQKVRPITGLTEYVLLIVASREDVM